MLKKVTKLAVVATFAAALSASATLEVQWSGAFGFNNSDDSAGITAALDGSTALAQLIFRPLAAGNTPDPAGVGGAVGSDETVLQENLITDSGGIDPYGTLTDSNFSGAYSDGFLYIRVFDTQSGLGGSGVVEGMWYYDSPVYAAQNIADPSAPQVITAHGANPQAGYPNADFLYLQVVPEPATFALMGLGGLALAIRRRRNV